MLISAEHECYGVDVRACCVASHLFVMSTKGCDDRITRIGDQG